MDVSRNLTVAERIRAGFTDLTRAERQLANALLANYPVLGLESMTAVAESSGVSTPTIVRMAKKLGFEGYPELQAGLRAELQATITNPIAKHDRRANGTPDGHILGRFADAVSNNIRMTLARSDTAEFDAIVELLTDHDRNVHVVGGRITRAMAEYFFTHMQVIRPGMTLIADNSNTWPHYVLNMKKDDVLVAFDIRRYENDLLRLVDMARSREVETVLFTDQWGSPAAKGATHVINARIEAPSGWDSAVAILFVVEALIAAVEHRNWETARERIRELEELLDKTRLFRKFV